MSKDTDYIASLIEYTIAEDNERVDLEACLEVADRANSNKSECLEVIRSLTKGLGKSSVKVVVNTLQLLETLCKNCNMRFLYELNNKKLVEAMLKVVVRRRDRAKYGTKASKTTNPLKIEAEEKVLFLLQLWADTFMMHQTEFRNIHDAYRNLRKDGVQFPERDPNQKTIINFQGQVSPVFLAMEGGNYIVPSNNQGGPIQDPHKKSQQSFKPKPVEYRHEYASSSTVQNTLYDENDDEGEYNPVDGIQITREEVKILEESIGILKEIERTATTSADMKGEIAKEILGDLVHVHKRLKRFLKTEKFASASQKNEAVRLSQVLSNCLSSYKTKYYKLKEEAKRQIRTEPDEDYRGKFQEDAPQRNFGRLATEYDESSYADKMKLSQDLVSNPKKGGIPVQKPSGQPRKFEAPSGWKSPLEVDKNLNGNPDLIDLLNTRDAAVAKNKSTVPKVEEKKEERMKTQGAQDLVNDLLDINFNTEPVQHSSGVKPSKENKKYVPTSGPFGMAAPKFASPVQTPSKNIDLFDFSDYPAPTSTTQASTTGSIQSQAKTTQNLAPAKVNSNDDDDFFSDIANRKK